ncbi:TetR family transcriptional regulator [Mycolicibacterium madagascariense]|uniref:TetR family transcriptional regulator n=1 Tax=Mycolicibacterium madagascariense TaxID=212765 RepID=A0A7I7XCZ2_9MYCO|nr:TetR family transcriptional regulator [Mycolicibacterium madagascariense]
MSLADRRAERRSLLLEAAFGLFGEGGEQAVSVRSVCREAGLNTRYFYESFETTDELLGAVYDGVNRSLATSVATGMDAAGGHPRERTRAGIAAVLHFCAADPRRGRILFTDAKTNPVLMQRRQTMHSAMIDLIVAERGRHHPHIDPVAVRVGAAMYTGAVSELTQHWLLGTLGTDVDAVVAHAVTVVLGS